jgi:methylglutaconyl-CoA hydratase
VRALREALRHARDDAKTRVLVLRSGVPGYFSVGMDLRALGEAVAHGTPPAEFGTLARDYVELLVDLVSLPCPSIVAVAGVAVGGGVDMTAACDIALASDGATFSIAMLRKGIFPITTSAVVGARIGMRHYFSWLASEAYYPARRAHAVGLVSEVVADAALPARVEDLARRLAEYDGDTVRLGMEAVRLGAAPLVDRLRAVAGLLARNMQAPGVGPRR